MRYYELQDDVTIPNRWFVREPVAGGAPPVRGNEFLRGTVIQHSGQFFAGLRRPGEPLDFTFADFGVPIVRRDIAERLGSLAEGDLQRIPVEIGGQSGAYDIINVVAVADCLNKKRSKITYWTEADGLPEKVGKCFSVIDPVIDPVRVGAHDVFRIAGWVPPIVVSERVAQVLSGATGVIIHPLESAGV
ncbi:MAG TPA: hypothetical protein VGB92_18850 [Longimicrobium sp.]|jgi:hypothetical protein